jgi:hypothetical protein
LGLGLGLGLGLVWGMMMLGCSSYGTDPDTAAVAGSWRWLSSTGGIAGRTYTPASEGYSVTFKFEGGNVTGLRNDSVKATASVLANGSSLQYAPPLNIFLFDPQIDKQTVRVLKGDTISLADPCCDRYDHVFIKAQ